MTTKTTSIAYEDPYAEDSVQSWGVVEATANFAGSAALVVAAGVHQTLEPIVSGTYSLFRGDEDSVDFSLSTTLGGLDEMLGTNTSGFYQERQKTIDTLGFGVATLAPGLGGLKLAQLASKAVMRTGIAGEYAALRYAIQPNVTYERAVAAGKEAILAGKGQKLWGNLLPPTTDVAKIMGAAITGSVTTAFIYDAAATTYLNSNPYYEGKTANELAKNVFENSIIYGGGFGVLQGVWGNAWRASRGATKEIQTNQIIESAISQSAISTNPLLGNRLYKAESARRQTGAEQSAATAKNTLDSEFVKNKEVDGVEFLAALAKTSDEELGLFTTGITEVRRADVPAKPEGLDSALPESSMWLNMATGERHTSLPKLSLGDYQGKGLPEIRGSVVIAGEKAVDVSKFKVNTVDPLEIEARLFWAKDKGITSSNNWTDVEWIFSGKKDMPGFVHFRNKDYELADDIDALDELRDAVIREKAAHLRLVYAAKGADPHQISAAFRVSSSELTNGVVAKATFTDSMLGEALPRQQIVQIRYKKQIYTDTPDEYMIQQELAHHEAMRISAAAILPELKSAINGKIDWSKPIDLVGLAPGVVLPSNPSLTTNAAHITRVGRLAEMIRQRFSDETARLQPHMEAVLSSPETAIRLSAATTWARQQTTADIRLFVTIDGKAALVRGDDFDKLMSNKTPKAESDEILGRSFKVEDERLAAFFEATMDKSAAHAIRHNTLSQHRNDIQNITAPKNRVVFPGVNLESERHVLFIKAPEIGPARTGEIIAIVGKTDDDALTQAQALIAKDGQYAGATIIDRKQTAAYYQMRGSFDYTESLNLGKIITTEERKGVLVGRFAPNPKDILEDFARMHTRNDSAVVRLGIESAYPQDFEKLRGIYGAELQQRLSTFESGSAKYQEVLSSFKHPALETERLMLNISNTDTTLMVNQAKGLLDAGGTLVATKLRDLWNSRSTPPEANLQHYVKIATDAFGSTAFSNEDVMRMLYKQSNDSQAFSRFVSAFNSTAVTLLLKLDPTQHLMNWAGRPISEIPELRRLPKSILDNPNVKQLLSEPWAVAEAKSAERFWSKEPITGPLAEVGKNKTYLQMLTEQGVVRSPDLAFAHELVDTVFSLSKTAPDSLWSTVPAKLKGYWDKFDAKLNMSESFQQYQAAMRIVRIGEAANMPAEEILSLASAAVQRSQGAYTAAQRPQLFSGPTGAAIGLFQTYQFRMMQRALDHIADGDTKAAVMMAGLQATFFGLRGFPQFDLMNKYIVSANSTEKNDAYVMVKDLVPGELGNAITYGALSSLTRASLFTRGELSIRTPTLVPINPAQWPSVSAVTSVAKAAGDFASRATGENGISLGENFLQFMERQAITRPMQGLAATIRGYSTDGKGERIASADELSEAGVNLTLATMWRLAGSKPLAEGIRRDTLSRYGFYIAQDAERRKAITKDLRISEGDLTEEQVAKYYQRYTSQGGSPRGFYSWYTSNLKKMESNKAESLIKSMRNSPLQENLRNELQLATPAPTKDE